MPFDFPNAPNDGDRVTGPNGGVYAWSASGNRWVIVSATNNYTTPGDVNAAVAPALGNVGRNYIMNGLWRVQQRGVGPWTTTGSYTADRWRLYFNLDTGVNCQIVAASDGIRSVIGDEAVQWTLSTAFTGNAGAASYTELVHQIEDAHRLGGKTVIVSFWAWTSAAPAVRIGVQLAQLYGSGGSPSAAQVTGAQTVQTTTGVVRYSLVFNVPSNAGKTFGTNNDSSTQIQIIFSSGATNFPTVGVQTGNVGLIGVQLEVQQNGQGNTPSLLEKIEYGEELRRCQRFYVAYTIVDDYTANLNSPGLYRYYKLPVTMRASPSVTFASNWQYYSGGANTAFTPIGGNVTPDSYGVRSSGLTNANGFSTGTFYASADL